MIDGLVEWTGHRQIGEVAVAISICIEIIAYRIHRIRFIHHTIAVVVNKVTDFQIVGVGVGL